MKTTKPKPRRRLARPSRRPRTGSPRPQPPLVAIVDDNPDVCTVIASTLKSVGLPTASFTNPVAFVDTFDPATCACIVLDVRMPHLSGFEVQQTLIHRGIDTPVVFVSGHGDIPMALAAIRAGAVTFLEKPWRDQVLIDAVNEAVALNNQRRAARSVHDALRTRLSGLTRREREIAIEVAAGRSAAEIGRRLGLSRRTVEMHRLRAMRRLGVHSSTELTRVIVEGRTAGLIQGEQT